MDSLKKAMTDVSDALMNDADKLSPASTTFQTSWLRSPVRWLKASSVHTLDSMAATHSFERELCEYLAHSKARKPGAKNAKDNHKLLEDVVADTC